MIKPRADSKHGGHPCQRLSYMIGDLSFKQEPDFELDSPSCDKLHRVLGGSRPKYSRNQDPNGDQEAGSGHPNGGVRVGSERIVAAEVVECA